MNVRGVNWVNGPMPVIEPTYLARIFAATSDIAFLVRTDGTILSALVEEGREHHETFAHWGGQPMQKYLTSESVPKFERALEAIAAEGDFRRRVELNHTDGSLWQFPVRYSFHAAGPGNSVLMLGHDLRFEAEMQEQLIQAQVALEQEFEQRRAKDAHYRVILSGTTEPFLFLSAADGRVRDLNAAAATFFGRTRDELIGVLLSDVIRHAGDLPLTHVLTSAASSGSEDAVGGTLARGGRDFLLVPTIYRATGERMIYCRVVASTEESPEAERLSRDTRALYLKGPEAIAFCSIDGTIREANDAFLELTELPSRSDALDRSLAEFLYRGDIDLGVILKQVRQSGRLGLYSTRLTNELGDKSLVHLSATLLEHGDGQSVGFVFRDAEKSEIIRRGVRPANQSESPNQSAVDLVGSATLKEIVAEANEVIEKICIETALELTKNNRAAAAEMLGVSRQSLYVKLRKYGLQERSEDG